MADREGIIKKVQALLNKAESTTYEQEADAFYAKAQDLMLQYAVDEAELEAAGKKKNESIVIRNVFIKRGWPGTEARQVFLNLIAKSFGCRTFLWTGTDQVAVVGYESDTMFVEMLFLSVNLQSVSAGRREVKEAKARASEWGEKFGEAAFRRGFMYGYLMRVAERVKERYDKKIEEVSESTAIVLSDKGKEVDGWIKDRFSMVDKKTRAKQIDFEAQVRGRIHGDNANIGVGDKAVGSSPQLPA